MCYTACLFIYIFRENIGVCGYRDAQFNVNTVFYSRIPVFEIHCRRFSNISLRVGFLHRYESNNKLLNVSMPRNSETGNSGWKWLQKNIKLFFVCAREIMLFRTLAIFCRIWAFEFTKFNKLMNITYQQGAFT